MASIRGRWWADPVAAIALAWLVLREALEAWQGEEELSSAADRSTVEGAIDR